MRIVIGKTADDLEKRTADAELYTNQNSHKDAKDIKSPHASEMAEDYRLKIPD